MGLTLSKQALDDMIGGAVKTVIKETFDELNKKRGGMLGIGGGDGNALGDHNPHGLKDAFGDGSGTPRAEQVKSQERKGLSFARYVQCKAAAELLQKEKGIIATPLAFAQEFYPNDDMVKSALSIPDGGVKALAIGDFTSGGAFGMQEMSAEVIEFLRPASVMTSTPLNRMQMRTGSLTVSKLTKGSQGSYVGENQLGGITEPSTGDVELTSKKLKAEIPASNDLFRFAVVNADQVIRDDMVRALSQRMDAALIRDDGSQSTPRGLRFIVPPQNVIPAGANSLTGIQATLGNMKLSLRGNDVPPGGWWWLMSPRTERRLLDIRTGVNENFAFRTEMSGGLLEGVPFAVTTQIPENLGGGSDSELYIFAAPTFILGESMDLEVTTSLDAAYFDGAALRSAFSRDQMVMRAIMQHDFGARYDFAVAVSPDVDWIPA